MTFGSRLKWARESAGLTQKQLSDATQIGESSISEYENDGRDPSALQMVRIGEVLKRRPEFFFESGEPQREVVLWREKPAAEAAQIELQLIELADQYQRLEQCVGNPSFVVLPFVDASRNNFSYPDADRLAHDFRMGYSLGERPGSSLLRVLEEVCRVKVFHLPFEPTGTAACTLDDRYGAAILLNSNNIRWRRNFDLAHELFHLLTWKVFRTGNHVAQASEHEEKLAQCFAGALLVPSEPLNLAIGTQRQGKKSLDFDDLFEVARQFDVSVQALVWQMVSNRIIEKSKAMDLLEKIEGRVNLWEKRKEEIPPPARPIRYEALAREAIEKGMIGSGVFAKYMGISRRAAMKIIETEIYTGPEYQASAEIEIVDP
jgi:Zn-dependent peptidase ImmA (M78 family)/transcriptional regulator with XRE-family HTH domain